jgi:hypothetical protein
MSQLPYTALEGRNPAGLVRPNRPPEVQPMPVDESLTAPGLAVPQPAVSRGMILAQGLSKVLGEAGSLGHEIGVQSRYARIARARVEEKAKLADQGNAAVSTGAILPGIIGQIHEGTETRSPDEIINSAIPAGASPAYTLKAKELMTEPVAKAIEVRREFLQNQQKTDDLSLRAAGVAGFTDPADAERAAADMKAAAPNVSTQKIKGLIVQSSLDKAKALAVQDPEGATKILEGVNKYDANNEFATERLLAQNHIDTAAKTKETRDLADIKENVGKMLDTNVPYPTIHEFIADQGQKIGVDVHALQREVETEHHVQHDRARSLATENQKSAEDVAANAVAEKELDSRFGEAQQIITDNRGSLPAKYLLSLSNQVRAHENQQIADAKAATKEAEKTAMTQTAQQQASALWDAGRGFNIQKYTDQHSDGTAFDIPKAKLLDDVANQKALDIIKDGAAKQQSPGEIQDRIVQDFGRNAYVPPQLESSIKGGAESLSEAAFGATDQGIAQPQLIAAGLAGSEQYDRVSRLAPGLLASMQLSPRTREIYEGTKALMGSPGIGDNRREAMLNAVRAADRPPSPLDTVRLGQVGQILDTTLQGDRDLWRDAAPLAVIYSKLGKPPDQSVAQAITEAKKSRIEINGWSSKAVAVPPDVKDEFGYVADGIIRDYAELPEHADGGVNKGDIAFRYNDQTGLWAMINAHTGLTVEPTKKREQLTPGGKSELVPDSDSVFFTTDELVNRAKVLKGDPDVQRELFKRRLRENQSRKPLFDLGAPFAGMTGG